MDANQRPLVRRPSTTLRSYLSRSTSTGTPRPSPQSLTLPSNCHTSAGLRSFVTRFRSTEPDFELLTPPRTASPFARTPPVPRISPLTKTFVNTLTATKLSDFLVWMLYYDIAELPASAESWYTDLSGLDMRGWVALGAHLKKTRPTRYGFDLVVLDSVCDRLRLERAVVHEFLVKFADPQTMRFSTLAGVVQDALVLRKSELEALDAVREHLHTLRHLAACLIPSPDSIYAAWHAVVQKRIQGFLQLVVRPRIVQRKEGTPLVTAGTSDRFSQEVRDGIQLNYVYEALLQERVVPVWRYEVDRGDATPPCSPSSPSSGDVILSRGRAEHLVQENQRLFSQVASLQVEKGQLVQDKRKLETRLATLRALWSSKNKKEAEDDTKTPCFWSWSPPTSESPRHIRTPRSNSPTPLPRAHQYATTLSHKYADVFSSLDSTPMSPSSTHLSDSLVPSPSSPHLSIQEARQGVKDQVMRSRRSGMVFDKASLEYLDHVGEGEG